MGTVGAVDDNMSLIGVVGFAAIMCLTFLALYHQNRKWKIYYIY